MTWTSLCRWTTTLWRRRSRPSRPSSRLRNNHLRFVGGLERGFRFDLKAEIPPFFLCSPQQIAFYVDNLAIGGSYSGNFCILPEPVSLSYDPLDPAGCQFQGTFFGWLVKFGSTCAEFGRAP